MLLHPSGAKLVKFSTADVWQVILCGGLSCVL
jgi:hypothetical protein